MIVRFGAARSLLNVLAGGDASKWSSPPEVPKLAMWVLGNIAGDGAAARDPLIAAGVVPVLTRAIETCGHTPTLRVATWALSNLCDGQPRPMLQVDSIIPVLAAALRCLDTEVLCHVCWVLSHLCDGPGAHIQAVVAANVCRHLVGLLTHPSWRVIKPALRAVGNIVCAEADVDYTHHIVLLGAVPCLRVLIEHPCKDIQKEACWTLSNIAAGSVDQIQAVLDSGAVPSIINLASNHATDPIVMAEARWVLLNATSCGSDAQVCMEAHTHTHTCTTLSSLTRPVLVADATNQIDILVRMGCVGVLCTLLADASMVMIALEGLEKILQVGVSVGRVYVCVCVCRCQPPHLATTVLHRVIGW